MSPKTDLTSRGCYNNIPSTAAGDSSGMMDNISEVNVSQEFNERTSKVMERLSTSSTNNKTVQEMTINKLRFSSLGFYGREKQTKILQQCLQDLEVEQQGQRKGCTGGERSNSNKQLVLLAGYSGSGKSTLALRLRDDPIMKRRKGQFVMGKYDLFLRDEPYSAIIDACQSLCQQVSVHLQKQEQQVQEKEQQQQQQQQHESSSTNNCETSTSLSVSGNQEADLATSSGPGAITSSAEEYVIDKHKDQADKTTTITDTPEIKGSTPDDPFASMREEFYNTLGEEQVKFLTCMIPNLKCLIFDHHQNSHDQEKVEAKNKGEDENNEEEFLSSAAISVSSDSTGGNDGGGLSVDGEWKSEQVKYAFRIFFRIVGKYIGSSVGIGGGGSRGSGTTTGPLIMFLDDLQWIDSASLQLLEVLLTDTIGNPNPLMILGCYRSNEVNNNNQMDHPHPLTGLIQRIKQRGGETRTSSICAVTELDVGNLTLEDTNQIIMALLNMDDDDGNSNNKTMGLAQICYKRTLGNVFFIIQFLVMLQEQNLLEFHLGLFQWTWDVSVIERSTVATNNVVDLVKQRMSKLHPPELLEFLQLAACLGSTNLDEQTMTIVWEHHHHRHQYNNIQEQSSQQQQQRQPQAKRETAHNLLLLAVEQSFLEEISSTPTKDNNNATMSCIRHRLQKGKSFRKVIKSTSSSTTTYYRWLHDKIQEAAISFIPEKELPKFKFDIGITLTRQLTKDELREELFVVVNLLNSNFDLLKQQQQGNSKPGQGESLGSLLNLQAAEKATSVSAFQSAARYAKQGIDLLPPKSWKTHFNTTLRLYSIGAEVHSYIGKVDQMKYYCDVVLSQSDCTTLNKLRVYHVLLDTLSHSGQAREAVEMTLDILGELGCRFPRNSMLQMLQTQSTIRALKRSPPSSSQIQNLSMMTDQTKVETIQLLYRLSGCCYYVGLYNMIVLANERIVRLTMEFGWCQHCLTAFQVMAGVFGHIISGPLGDVRTAKIYDSLVPVLLKRTGQTKGAAQLSMAIAGQHVWIKPMQSQMEPILMGYKSGMQLGDIMSAMWCIAYHAQFHFFTGKSLQKLDEEYKAYIPQMKELGQTTQLHVSCCIWQGAKNLMGLSKNPLDMQGDVFGWEKDETAIYQMASSCLSFLRHLELTKNLLYTYFGEYQLGADLAMERGDSFTKSLMITPGSIWDTFCRGVCLFAAAGQTKRSRYKKEALRIRRIIRHWVKQGNPNVVHHADLMDAEYYALQKKNHNKASKAYNSCIVTAARGGFLHDAGLANERYSRHLLSNCSDVAGATFRLEEAIRWYEEWGAMAKVNTLRNEHKELLRATISQE